MFIPLKASNSAEWQPVKSSDLFVKTMLCASENSHLPFNQGIKCFTKCALEKMGIFDGTNGLNVERLVEMSTNSTISESLARTIVTKCAIQKQQSETKCEWAYRAFQCLHSEAEAKNEKTIHENIMRL